MGGAPWLYWGYTGIILDIRIILGLYWGDDRIMLGLYWGYIGIILGYRAILGHRFTSKSPVPQKQPLRLLACRAAKARLRRLCNGRRRSPEHAATPEFLA